LRFKRLTIRLFGVDRDEFQEALRSDAQKGVADSLSRALDVEA